MLFDSAPPVAALWPTGFLPPVNGSANVGRRLVFRRAGRRGGFLKHILMMQLHIFCAFVKYQPFLMQHQQPYIFLAGHSRRGFFFRSMSLAQFGRARRHFDKLPIEIDAVLIGSLL